MDEDEIADVLGSFIVDGYELVKSMSGSVAQNNVEKLHFAELALKGVSGTIGAKYRHELCRNLCGRIKGQNEKTDQ